MKEKFIKIISPAGAVIVSLLDAAVIGYAVFAIKKLAEQVSVYSIIFLFIEIAAIVIGILVTKEVFTQGVIFKDDSLEFTGMDEHNAYFYDDIEEIEVRKDKKASLVKNFNDRRSRIIFHLRDGGTDTVDIGLTSSKTLKNIEEEILKHIKSDD